MFAADNTEGFTAAELATLNGALEILMKTVPGAEESSLSDMLNNAWYPGADTDDLVMAVDRTWINSNAGSIR